MNLFEIQDSEDMFRIIDGRYARRNIPRMVRFGLVKSRKNHDTKSFSSMMKIYRRYAKGN